MTFISKKEEVINFQITRFGRELLKRGRFRPVYYRFFDDGIIYDTSWATTDEVQNDSEPRIKIAPTPRQQSTYVGVETTLNKEYATNDITDSSIDRYYSPLYEDQDEEERIFSLRYPLYTSRLGTDKTPSFNVLPINEPFTGSLKYSTGSGENIPQVSTKFESLTWMQSIDPAQVESALMNESMVSDTQIFNDGTLVTTTQKFYSYSLSQENVPDSLHGFEIEMYEEISGSLVPMYFEGQDDGRLVSKYFEILVDTEVPVRFRSPLTRPQTSMFSKLDQDPPQLSIDSVDRIYTSLPSDEDIEDCD